MLSYGSHTPEQTPITVSVIIINKGVGIQLQLGTNGNLVEDWVDLPPLIKGEKIKSSGNCRLTRQFLSRQIILLG